MTSVCAASSIPYAVVSAGAVAIADPTAPAMKRRRENNHGGVAIISELIPKMEHQMPRLVMSAPLVAAQPIVTVRKSQGAKRPQMKYDPSVPMTKEETSAWRREQRRKRNRESAAACRKRQRDRISELEIEVNGWKDQFEGALNKLKGIEGTAAGEELRGQLEAMFAIAPSKMEVEGAPTSSSTAQTQQRCSTPPNVPEAITSMIIPVHQGVPFTVPSHHVVSPHDRPKFIPPVTSSMEQQVILEDISFPILEADPIIKANDFLGGIITPTNNSNIASRVETRQHLNEKITRPAVKIAGAVPTPLDNIESVCDDLLQVVPDSCLSLTEKKTMPFPEACPSLVDSVGGPASSAVDDMPNVTTDESGEDSDLGEFLLDAVNWL